jgi:uncharacterized glyoxalase superfamily protein PhnB
MHAGAEARSGCRPPPQKQVYGEYQATLRDFAGHIWTLTLTVDDVDPAVWGGEAVEI